MKIKIITISKTDKDYIAHGVQEYKKMLKKWCEIEFDYIKETPIRGDDIERIKKQEGEKILGLIPSDYYKVMLDLGGKQMDSEKFAYTLENIRDFEGGKVAFIIGGPLGLDQLVKDSADMILSFSNMTFSHQIIRLILMEQLYRAFSILAGTGYHK